MTRAFDFTLSGTLVIIAAVGHRISVELFAPESPLHRFASKGEVLNGAARADLWFQILAVWVPLLMIGFAFAYLLIREYRRQVATATRSRV